jgi:hypothetical protein
MADVNTGVAQDIGCSAVLHGGMPTGPEIDYTTTPCGRTWFDRLKGYLTVCLKNSVTQPAN